jgi:hypothetical protein
MKIYTVHEPPDAPADRLDRADSLVFVKDGFTWAAALFAPLWFLVNRMWLVLVAYIGGMAILQLLLALSGTGQRLSTLIMAGVHILIGFEADTLRRWTLDRNGWRLVGSVTGRNWTDCERRFFEAWLPGEPYVRADALSPHGGSLPLSGAASATQPGRWRGRFPFTPKPAG